MKSFQTSTLIQAPAETIWRILTDAPNYPKWNTTVTKVEGRIAPGEKVTVHVKINPGRAFPVKVSEFITNQKMVWEGGMPLVLFMGARSYTLTLPSVGVEFSMQEVYSGLMSPLIEKSIPDMQPAFEEFAACLKKAAEGFG